MQRSEDEVKQRLESLNADNCDCNLSAFDEGLKESLEFISSLQKRFKDKKSVENLLLEYKHCIVARYESDILIYKNDVTGGWLKGSLEGIDWFLRYDL